MPIYRGSTKVTPVRDAPLSRVYRGDQQVYSSMPALIRSAPDYWYTLDYKEYPYKSYGSQNVPLTFVSGSFHDRGGHALVAGAKSKINVRESWSDAAWSASCWLQKTGSPGKIETLFGRGVNGGPLVTLWTNGANEINLDIGSSPYAYKSSATVPASGWYHLAVTCKLENGRNLVTAYVDGVSVAQFFATNAGIPSFSPSHYVTFGNHPNPSSSYPFDGNIDDLALWSRTLSPGEISAIYRGGRGVVPPEQLPEKLQVSLAATEPYRVAFAGSSTTQGWGQPQYESYVHIFLTRLLRHVMDANATKMVVQNSGTVTRPSAKGFHFLNIGLGGTTSANYINSTRRSMINTYAPRLIIHMIGANDYAEQMPIATYKQNLRNQLQDQTMKHVLVHTYRRQDRADTGITWAMYGQALKEVAAEFPNTYFVDAGALWEQRRGSKTYWLQSDRIHTTWAGAQELSEALGDAMRLEMNSGQTIWAFEASQAGQANGQIQPTPESIVRHTAVSPSSGTRVDLYSDGGTKVFTFNNSGARYADTPGFDAAYGMPLAFFVVVNSFGAGGNETPDAPWFSRSVFEDDGWWWAWKNGWDYRAALNSAFSPPANITTGGSPRIIGVHMMPNSQSRIYVHSHNNTLLPPELIDESLGPWMKSLRIGASSNASNYMSNRVREMRWETAPMNADEYMPQRMTELATKHGLTLV